MKRELSKMKDRFEKITKRYQREKRRIAKGIENTIKMHIGI